MFHNTTYHLPSTLFVVLIVLVVSHIPHSTSDMTHGWTPDQTWTRLGQPRTTPGGVPTGHAPGRPTPSLPTSPWSIRSISLFSFVMRMDKTEEDRGRYDLERKSRRRVDLPLAGLRLGHAALTTRVVPPASLLPLLLPAHDSRSPPSSPPHRPCLCAPLSFSQDNGAPRGDLPPRSGDRPSGSGFPAAAAPTRAGSPPTPPSFPSPPSHPSILRPLPSLSTPHLVRGW